VRQHAPADTEVIVVDDGSPEGRVSAVARSFAVDAIRLKVRRGFCAAANRGINATAGQVIELLNDDTKVTQGWAHAALDVFQEPAVGAVAPLVLRAQPGQDAHAIIDSAGDRYYIGGIAAKRGAGQPLRTHYLMTCEVFGASGSSAFYRRQALEQVGVFPRSFGAYFEDVDLAFRLRRAGYTIRFEPASRVYHAGSTSYGHKRRSLIEMQSCNEERVFWRNLPVSTWKHALPRHAAVLAAKAWRRWAEGQFSPFLFGRLRAFAEWPSFFSHRKSLDSQFPLHSEEQLHIDKRYWQRDQLRGLGKLC
jgi:GT2 family glycosyltransferase